MSLINSTQAHAIADSVNENLFGKYIQDLHATIKTHANRGSYETSVQLPVKYQNKSIAVLQYFNMFGYKVSLHQGRVTIAW